MTFLIVVAIGAMIAYGSPTTFEVASVKPTPKERLYLLKRECRGDRFSAAGMPLSFIIPWSYQLNSNRIQGLPDWVNEREYAYDFEAKAADPMTDDQCKLMVQSLLADRFKMTVHRESREMRVYELVVSKKGKLREVPAEGDGEGVRINGTRFQSLSDAEAPKGLFQLLSARVCVQIRRRRESRRHLKTVENEPSQRQATSSPNVSVGRPV